jgi:hypothetical protein
VCCFGTVFVWFVLSCFVLCVVRCLVRDVCRVMFVMCFVLLQVKYIVLLLLLHTSH